MSRLPSRLLHSNWVYRLFLIPAFAVVILTQSCSPPSLDFLNQEVYSTRSGLWGKDLYLLIIYDGFYAPTEEIEPGIQELDEFISEGDRILHQSWFFGGVQSLISIKDIKEELEEMDEEEIEKEPAAFRFKKHLVDNLEIRFGGLFQNKDTGRFSAYQVAQLRGVKRFVRLGNTAFCEHALGEMNLCDDESTSTTFPLTEALWTELFHEGKYQWFELEGSALAVNVPVVPSEIKRLRASFLQEVFSPAIRDEATTADLQLCTEFFSEHPFSMIQKMDGFRFIWGDPEEKVNKLVIPVSPDNVASYSDNLLDWAMKQECWKGDLDVESIVERFGKSGARFIKSLPGKER